MNYRLTWIVIWKLRSYDKALTFSLLFIVSRFRSYFEMKMFGMCWWWRYTCWCIAFVLFYPIALICGEYDQDECETWQTVKNLFRRNIQFFCLCLYATLIRKEKRRRLTIQTRRRKKREQSHKENLHISVQLCLNKIHQCITTNVLCYSHLICLIKYDASDEK